MNRSRKKPVIGILGGVVAGKSTVAAEFGRLGCKVIDADLLAHQLLDDPDIKKKIVDLFSRSVLDLDNKVNRKRLADIVFNDKEKLTQLNNIIHPAVLSRTEQLIEEFNRQQEVKAIVLDMPLLLEVGWAERCDKLVFVDCSLNLRVKRAEKMGLFDENQLKIRENLQISLDKKLSIAENIIDNNEDLSALKKQVAALFSIIKNSG